MDHRRRVWSTLYSDFQFFSLTLQGKAHTGQVREQNDVEIGLLLLMGYTMLTQE